MSLNRHTANELASFFSGYEAAAVLWAVGESAVCRQVAARKMSIYRSVRRHFYIELFDFIFETDELRVPKKKVQRLFERLQMACLSGDFEKYLRTIEDEETLEAAKKRWKNVFLDACWFKNERIAMHVVEALEVPKNLFLRHQFYLDVLHKSGTPRFLEFIIKHFSICEDDFSTKPCCRGSFPKRYSDDSDGDAEYARDMFQIKQSAMEELFKETCSYKHVTLVKVLLETFRIPSASVREKTVYECAKKMGAGNNLPTLKLIVDKCFHNRRHHRKRLQKLMTFLCNFDCTNSAEVVAYASEQLRLLREG